MFHPFKATLREPQRYSLNPNGKGGVDFDVSLMCRVTNKGVGASSKGVYEAHYKDVSNLSFFCETLQ